MRIIAGKYKGTRLFPPTNSRVRPTTDRVREYIFSCLGADVVQAVVLDLFAGSGSLGLEAKSRGASRVDFVDRAYPSIAVVKKNLQKVNLRENVYKMDAFAFLKHARKNEYKYDLLFCDPPYLFSGHARLVQTLHQTNVLYRHSMIVFETTPDKADNLIHNAFEIEKQKQFGETHITFSRVLDNGNS